MPPFHPPRFRDQFLQQSWNRSKLVLFWLQINQLDIKTHDEDLYHVQLCCYNACTLLYMWKVYAMQYTYKPSIGTTLFKIYILSFWYISRYKQCNLRKNWGKRQYSLCVKLGQINLDFFWCALFNVKLWQLFVHKLLGYYLKSN